VKAFISCVLLAIVIILTSCTSTHKRIPPPSPSTPAPIPVPTRDILISGQDPVPGYGAYGYIVFTKRPMDLHSSNEYALCKAYVAGFEPTSSFITSTKKVNMMPTFWLLSSETHMSCEYLVNNYDYAKAKLISSAINKLDSTGPIFVAWSSPFEKAQGKDALMLDLSDIEEEQYSEIIAIWSSRITKSPELWGDGFKIEKIRAELKSFLNKNGDSIVSVIEWFKEIAS